LVSGGGFAASIHRNKDAPFKKPRKSTITPEKKDYSHSFFMPKKILMPAKRGLWGQAQILPGTG
jgi:hypothetical protein